MATATTIPVLVAAGAAEHVRRLGLEAALAVMIEHAQESIEGLSSLRISLERDPTEGDARVVLLAAKPPVPDAKADSTEDAFSEWKLASFSPSVCVHFCLLTVYRNEHGR